MAKKKVFKKLNKKSLSPTFQKRRPLNRKREGLGQSKTTYQRNQKKPKIKCKDCELWDKCKTNCISGRGDLEEPEIMFVGEAPGQREDETGKPFMGPSGRILGGAIDSLPEDVGVRITNAVRCRPPDNATPKIRAHIQPCRKHLEKEINLVKPRVIIPLGNVALKSLIDETGINALRGKVMDCPEFNCKIVPTYHPSYILRNRSKEVEQEFANDVKLAYEVATGKRTKERSNLPDTVIIQNDKELKKLEKRLLKADRIAIDIESTTYKAQKQGARILCVGFAIDGAIGVCVPYLHKDRPKGLSKSAVKKFLKRVMNSKADKIAHNWFMEYPYLKHKGFPVRNPKYDTMYLSYQLNEEVGNHALDVVGRRFCGYSDWALDLEQYFNSLPRENEKGRPKNYGDIPGDMLFRYNAIDASVTAGLLDVLLEALDSDQKKYRQYCKEFYGLRTNKKPLRETHAFLRKTIVNLSKMSADGWSIDYDLLEKNNGKYEKLLTKRTKTLAKHPKCKEAVKLVMKNRRKNVVKKLKAEGYTTKEAREEAKKKHPLNKKFNTKSPDHKRTLIFDVLGFETNVLTDTGLPSTDKKKVLQYLDHPLVKKILDVSEISDLLSKYLRPMLNTHLCVDDKIHPSYNLMAVTGRVKSNDPNGQNIPEHTEYAIDIKRVVGSRYKGGKIIGTDYGQQELRVLAAFSGEQALIDAFINGEDPHLQAAYEIYSDKAVRKIPRFKNAVKDLDKNGKSSKFRTPIKTTQFGIIYGKSAWGLCSEFGFDPEDDEQLHAAETILDIYFKKRPKVKEFIDRCHAFVKEHKCVITPPPVCRIRRLPNVDSDVVSLHRAALRESTNAPIQGAASDILLSAMNDFRSLVIKERAKVTVWNIIHDAMYIDAHPDWVDWALENQVRVMESQSKKFMWLGDIPLLAEPKVGNNWGDLKEIK